MCRPKGCEIVELKNINKRKIRIKEELFIIIIFIIRNIFYYFFVIIRNVAT